MESEPACAELDAHAVDECGEQFGVGVEGDEIGAGSEVVDEAEHGGGIDAGHSRGVGEVEFSDGGGVGDGGVEGEDTPGEFVVVGGDSVGDADVEGAERVGSVGHAGGGDGICNQK